ncbi:MAG: PEP-CTERM sorting domain-containing protein [Akkermansiaceae bacterium]
MNLSSTIRIGFFASLLSGSAVAQQLSFNDFSLVKGKDLQKGSSYRFYNVTSGVDAVIKVERLSNASLVRIDDSPIARDALGDSAWRPIVSGVSNSGQKETHYVDFSVGFYANGGNRPVGLDSLTMSIFDTDGDNDLADFSDNEDGNVIEFARVTGFSSLLSTGNMLEVTYNSNGSATVRAKDSTTNDGVTDAAPWLSVWKLDDKHSYSVRLGWEGTDDDMSMDNDRLFGAYFTGVNTPEIVPVPEPSTALLALIGAAAAMFRRNRKS